MSAIHRYTIPSTELTNREREIAGLLADGVSPKAIAQLLNVSHATVRTHKGRIFERLGLHSTRAVVEWVKQQRVA